MNKHVATQNFEGTIVIKGSDHLEMKVWVIPHGKTPRPAVVTAEMWGRNLEWRRGRGRLVVALRSIAGMRVVSTH